MAESGSLSARTASSASLLHVPDAEAPVHDTYINVEKLRCLVGSIVECPSYDPHSGGIASTDTSSFAVVRASLILVALQCAPLLSSHFGPGFSIASLRETDPARPHMPAVEVLNAPARGEAVSGDAQSAVVVYIVCRDATHNTPLPPPLIRTNLLSALSTWKASLSAGAEPAPAMLARLEAAFGELKGRVPMTLAHLVHMHALPEDFVDVYNAATCRTASLDAAPSLWWPLHERVRTFKCMVEHATRALAHQRRVEAEAAADMRERMRTAALARAQSFSGAPAALHAADRP